MVFIEQTILVYRAVFLAVHFGCPSLIKATIEFTLDIGDVTLDFEYKRLFCTHFKKKGESVEMTIVEKLVFSIKNTLLNKSHLERFNFLKLVQN